MHHCKLTIFVTTINMQSCLFLTLVIVVVGINADTVLLTDVQKEQSNANIAACIKESGVKPEILAEAKKGNYSEDEAMKKFLLCFFNKSGIMNADGKLNLDVALANLPPGVDKNEATKALEECQHKNGKDAADTAFTIFKCYSTATKTQVLF
ncbi:general odorant-binding protein 83a [Manduca sexta]|uniref:general odorant-binding protein 83a n=1 Tax=Manduca sexta TaxID=7130 RepID=UPI00188E7A63|nr:general odorant-binding protein 83a [Manduca sexta]